MKQMKKISTFSMLLLLTVSVLLGFYQTNNQFIVTGVSEEQGPTKLTPNAYSLIKTENLTLELKFIGFDQTLVNESSIEAELFDSFSYASEHPTSAYEFDFEFSYATQQEYNDLENYIRNTAATNGTGTGYKINITLLKEDLASGVRSDEVFMPCDGMSINALMVEEYLKQNLYEIPPSNKPGYTLFLMNMSTLDSEDHSLEHWYDTYDVCQDSNTTEDWWYSGYRNIPKRSSSGWGGNYRFCYVDLSARTWYFDFIQNAWYGLNPGSAIYYDFPDLDNLTQTFDPSTSLGKSKITEYIVDWTNSYIGNVFSGPIYNPPIAESVSLQVLVLNNLTLNGYPENDLKWVISQSRIYNQLKQDFPWIDWQIEIVWQELTDYPDLFDFMQDDIKEDINGKYIEVLDGLFFELENQLSTHFDSNRADVVLPCYFFLNNNVGLRYSGTSFAGLGGMGWEILLGTQYSLFENGNSSEPRRGMSSVMVHELGHSLGLPHPHSGTYGWGADFVADVMSYFAYSDGFSIFNRDAVGRAHSDAHFSYAQDELTNFMQLYSDAGEPAGLTETINQINTYIDEIPDLYQAMDYNASAATGIAARALIDYAIDFLNEPPPSSASTTVTFGFNILFLFPVVMVAMYGLIRRYRK